MTKRLAPCRKIKPAVVGISRDWQVSAIRNYNRFTALRGEWNRLAATHPLPSRFLSFEWTDAAWQWCRQQGSPLILAVTAGAHPLGLLALFKHGRQLQALAVPDNQAWDLIAGAADMENVAALCADWLVSNAARWHGLSLRPLRADSPGIAALLAALRRRRLHPALEDIGPNYAIALTGTWADYYRTRSRRLKKGNNLIANRLAQAGELRLEWRRGSAVDTATLDLLAELSAVSWKGETGTTLDHAGPAAFFRRLGEHSFGTDWLSVWILWLNERPLATELQLIDSGRVHGLRADYREDASDLSPGTYLNWKIIEALFGQGFTTYSLGLGENPYKRRWTDGGPLLQRLTAYSPHPRGQVLRLLSRGLLPAARRVRAGLARLRPAH